MANSILGTDQGEQKNLLLVSPQIRLENLSG